MNSGTDHQIFMDTTCSKDENSAYIAPSLPLSQSGKEEQETTSVKRVASPPLKDSLLLPEDNVKLNKKESNLALFIHRLNTCRHCGKREEEGKRPSNAPISSSQSLVPFCSRPSFLPSFLPFFHDPIHYNDLFVRRAPSDMLLPRVETIKMSSPPLKSVVHPLLECPV